MNFKQSIVEKMIEHKAEISQIKLQPIMLDENAPTYDELGIDDLVKFCKHWLEHTGTPELLGLCMGFVEWVTKSGLYNKDTEYYSTFEISQIEVKYHDTLEKLFQMTCPWVGNTFRSMLLPFNDDLGDFAREENSGRDNPKRIAWVEAIVEVFGE